MMKVHHVTVTLAIANYLLIGPKAVFINCDCFYLCSFFILPRALVGYAYAPATGFNKTYLERKLRISQFDTKVYKGKRQFHTRI